MLISNHEYSDLGLPAFHSKYVFLSGTHERTGFFQVRANMGSNFKIVKKSGSFSALISKKTNKSGPVLGLILVFFTLKHHFTALFFPKKSGSKEQTAK